jgi:hypothetical protein
MGEKFRNFSCYGKSGRKVEYQTDASLEGESNSEQIIVDGDIPGASEGVPTSSASIDSAICVGGKDSTQTLFDLYESGEYTEYTFGIIDGRIMSANMKVKSIKYTGKAANGTTTFSAQLMGGRIKKVG